MASLRNLSLKNVSRIRVSFCSFDPKSGTARDFLRRVSAAKMRTTNPKCEIKADVKNDGSNSSIAVTLANGKDVQFNPTKTHLLDILREFKAKTDNL